MLMKKFRLLIVAATPFEIGPLLSHLTDHFQQEAEGWFVKDNFWIKLLVTGVGQTHTAYFLGRLLQPGAFDMAINAGIAGAFNRSLAIGDVVNVVSERFGDLGVEEADGRFTDMHELGLIEPDSPPFQFGILHNPEAEKFSFMNQVNGLTVNKVHGYEPSIEKIHKKYGSDIETMEGAAFFLAALYVNVSFLQIRAISNYVESRNRDNWNLPLAIEKLNTTLLQIIEGLQLSLITAAANQPPRSSNPFYGD